MHTQHILNYNDKVKYTRERCVFEWNHATNIL